MLEWEILAYANFLFSPARLEMRHTCVSGAGTPTSAELTSKVLHLALF